MALNALADLHFAHPGWLWATLPVLAAWIALPKLLRQQRRAGADTPGYSASPAARYRHPRVGTLIEALHGLQARRFRQRAWWQILVLICLLVALAQPERIGAQLPQPAQHRNIVFIVDNSVAMNLRDYVFEGQRVDRLTVLKGVLNRFVDKLPGDRISLVLYADKAYTMVPLTYDHDLIHAMLSQIETGLAGRSNAVGDAVALAVKEAGERGTRRRILVLFSSAARPTGAIEPLDAARLAARRKLPLYTIVIGAGTAAAQERRASGLIYDPADQARLQAMAQITGAASYVATDTRALSAAITAIGKLEADPVADQPRFVHTPLYQWSLLAALAVLSVAQLGALFRRRQWN